LFAPYVLVPLSLALLLAAYTDLRRRLIYNWLTLPGILCFLLLHGLFHPAFLPKSLLGVVLLGGGSLLLAVLSGGQLGGGDVKLFALLGAALGWQAGLLATICTYLLAGCAALVIVLVRRFLSRTRAIRELPLAPFIAAGTALCYFVVGGTDELFVTVLQ